jgi:hypothetical protein
MRRFVITIIAALATTLAATGHAAGQDQTAFAKAAAVEWDTVVIHSGALVSQFGSDIRVDPTVGPFGTSINLENLGFNSSATSFFADGTWRISRRNQLQARFNRINRDVSNVLLTRTVTFRNETFDVGARIDSFLDTTYVSVDYGFAIVATPRVEVGATIGLTALRVHTGMGLSAQISGTTGGSRQLSEDVQFTAPVPLPGGFINVRVHPRVTIDGFARYLKVTIGNFGGGMTEARGGADVKLLPWLGVGGAYYYNHLTADHAGNVFTGRIDYAFNGPQIYVLLAF